MEVTCYIQLQYQIRGPNKWVVLLYSWCFLPFVVYSRIFQLSLLGRCLSVLIACIFSCESVAISLQSSITHLWRWNINRSCFAYDGWHSLTWQYNSHTEYYCCDRFEASTSIQIAKYRTQTLEPHRPCHARTRQAYSVQYYTCYAKYWRIRFCWPVFLLLKNIPGTRRTEA